MSSASFELNNKIFRAGAGAGKTTRLVQEVYEFYKFFKAKNNKNPRVVLTTFTRKATQELRERLMHEAQKKKDYEFLNFVLSKNSLSISTIHGALQLFLKQYAQLIDLDPGFRLTDDKEIFKRAKIILKKILSENSEIQELLEEFTFKQLASLILEHIEAKKKSTNLSFFNKNDFIAAQNAYFKKISDDLLNFSERILSETENDKWIEYAKILKTSSQNYGAIKSLNDLERAETYLWEVRKPGYTQKNPPFSESLNEELEDFRKELKKIELDQFNQENWDEMIRHYELFDKAANLFSEKFDFYKKSTGQITISDLELYSYELVRLHPHDIHFFSQGYDYWLIDEFQDTSPLQVKLLKALIQDRKKFVVGDPQQSIYFFRGARVQVFDEMQAEIIDQGGIFDSLNKNYRSNQNTMSFINHFFKGYSDKFQSMELCGPESKNKNVAKVCLSNSEEDQNLAILTHIHTLIKSDVELGEICILGRKNDQLKKIAEILNQKKLPYILHSASGFQERREILDALAILKFLVNPHDNFNLIQILRSPWFKVLDHHIHDVVKENPESFWVELQKKTDSDYEAIIRLKKYVKDTYQEGITHTFQNILMDTGFFELSYQYDSSGRRESNLWKLIIQLKTEDHAPDFNYIDFIENRKSSLDLEAGSADSDAVSSIEPNRIQLMTVHMSKGLEFKHVIIPYVDSEPQLTKYLPYTFDTDLNKYGIHLKLDFEKGIQSLPSRALVQKIKDEELSESDRLLYVAMTRAKETIFLSTSGARIKSNSWFTKMKLNVSEGIQKHSTFEYEVQSGPWEDIEVQAREVQNQKISEKLFDLEKLAKKESTQVTAEVEVSKKSHQSLIKILEKANYGRLAHQIFESLKYNKELSADENTKKAIQYIQNLKEVPMKEILKNGFAEWGFVLNQEGHSLSGQIDLWGEVNNELWVIDYKTGSSYNSEVAFDQLTQYASALKNFIQTDKVHIVALYPFEQKYFLKDL